MRYSIQISSVDTKWTPQANFSHSENKNMHRKNPCGARVSGVFWLKAGDGNRTHAISLEGCSLIMYKAEHNVQYSVLRRN